MSKDDQSLERKGQKNTYTPLSTEYSHLHNRMLEEFPDGPYGSPLLTLMGKQSGWDTGEEVSPRFSYENEQAHDEAQRPFPQRDPIRDQSLEGEHKQED